MKGVGGLRSGFILPHRASARSKYPIFSVPQFEVRAVAEITPKPVLVAMGPGVRWLQTVD
jgi:hypothetical protein